MRLTLADETILPYEAIATRQGRPVETVVEAQLVRFASLPPGEPAIVLAPEQIARLAAAVSLETLPDAATLVTRVERLGALSFEGVAIRLTPAQKAELARRADRQGRTVKAIVAEVVARVLSDLVWSTGAGEPVGAGARKAG